MSLSYYPTDIEVGEIVILHPRHDGRKKHKHPLDGFKTFVEEIVVQPTPIDQLRNYSKTKSALAYHSGTYSLYGFKQNDYFGHLDWYIGDYKGIDFERTGNLISEFELNKLYDKSENDKMFRRDIVTVRKNLGRDYGRNQ